jgi:GrpB-like predicted nucleotidyltransferase (UPF0157 family)
MAPESLHDRVRRVASEDIAIVPYDPGWPRAFAEERERLRALFGPDLIGRIEHFGSTAVPGLAAKPIVDLLVEVYSLERAREAIAPVLEARGYDYFWRPTFGDDGGPWYCWFIRRENGRRTHHLHMVEPSFKEHWDRLKFRDALRADPARARAYEALKRRLAAAHPNDRAAYTQAKSEFIRTAISMRRGAVRL